MKIPTDLPRYATVLAFMHSHTVHEDEGFSIYIESEYSDVKSMGRSSFVVDRCGSIYVLKPDAIDCADHEVIKNICP